jgi:cell wall-associated NlpC family hydrolase
MTDTHYPQAAAPTPVSGPCLARIRLFIEALLMGLLLAGCASTSSDRSADPSRDGHRYAAPTGSSAISNEVLMRAISLVGTPYRYGGNSPEGGFDCSGLVDFVFLDAAGVQLPRSTRELIALDAPKITRAMLQPGDLVFFNPGGGSVSHIGIYVGEDRFVHAPSTGGTVRLDTLQSEYWEQYYQGAKRVLH